MNKKQEKHNKEWEKIVHEVALKYGLTDTEAKVITDAPFKFIKHVAFREKRSVRYQHLGIFAVYEKKRFRNKDGNTEGNRGLV